MKHFLFVLFMLAALPSSYAETKNPCSAVTSDSITRHVPVSGVIVSKRDVNGICEVILKIRQEYVPVYVSPDFVIAGEMFQNKKQITKKITEELKKKSFTLYRERLDKCVSIKYRPQGSIEQTIYMITDPKCSHCNLAMKKIKEIADVYQAEVKIILYSVHGSSGQKKVIEAICRNFDFNQYADKNWIYQNETNKYQCSNGIERAKQNGKTMKRLGVTGVPVFYLGSGKKIVGADMPALIKSLNLEKTRIAGTY